jgi:hypothetical protein
MLSQAALDAFKAICREEYGVELSDDVATAQAINLLTFYNAIYRPVKKGWLPK